MAAGKRSKPKPGCRPYVPKGKPLKLTHQGTEILVYRERGNHFRVVAPPEVLIDKGLTLPPPTV